MNAPEGQTTLKAIVRGRVQGVGYRLFTLQRARDLKLTGCVRNLPDGGVEIRACGSLGELTLFVETLERGPMMARVDNIDAQWGADIGVHKEFTVGF